MKLTIAARKHADKTWDGALVSEGRFQRALVGETLEDVVLRGLAGFLSVPHPIGVSVVVDVTTETAEEIAATGQNGK